MKELNFDALLQVTGGTDKQYKADYTIYATNFINFEIIQKYVSKLEKNEITLVEFFEQVYPYTCYARSEYNWIEIHIAA